VVTGRYAGFYVGMCVVYADKQKFTEFTEAVNDNTDGISRHRLSPYNAHYLIITFYSVMIMNVGKNVL